MQKIVSPLNALLSPIISSFWNEETQAAFELLEVTLHGQVFQYVHARYGCLGHSHRSRTVTDCVIGHASKSLSKTERTYRLSMQSGCLGIIIKYFLVIMNL